MGDLRPKDKAWSWIHFYTKTQREPVMTTSKFKRKGGRTLDQPSDAAHFRGRSAPIQNVASSIYVPSAMLKHMEPYLVTKERV